MNDLSALDTGNLADGEEINRVEQAVQAYLDRRMDADRFKAARLQQGVYGQRQEGVNMVRIKVPGGRLTSHHLRAVADVAGRYAPGHPVHITTRQDFQLYYVPLQHTPAVMRRLAEDGLTTREACGNTVRNITSCPLAGICPAERADVTPFINGAVKHFLRHPLTQHLPRKFKISFSSCETDCAQGMAHDVGVVAVKRDGRFGFKVLAGGGLGHKPREALTVESFIEEQYLLPTIEAVISLHNRYSDRTKRARSRVKFLVDRFGVEGFLEKYREELARTKAIYASQGSAHPKGTWTDGSADGQAYGAGAPRTVLAQKQPGLNVFPISTPIGDVSAQQLSGIAQLMDDLGLTDIRTTQDQNLMLINVPTQELDAVRARLAALGLGVPQAGDDVVACPGSSTCRLGITSSKIVAKKLIGITDLSLRVSGCQNGCAQPQTGEIGIYGQGKRLHGKLIPHYQMYFGGDGRGSGGLAVKGPEVPTVRVESAIKRVNETYLGARRDRETFFQWVRRQEAGYFEKLLAEEIKVAPEDVPFVIKDHGEESAFKVLQLGGGECAGAAQESVAANFAEAAYERDCRDGYLYQRKNAEALECAEAIARSIGQALLFLATRRKIDDADEIAKLLPQSLTQYPQPAEKFTQLHAALKRMRAGFDEAAFPALVLELDGWVRQAGEVATRLDAHLDLAASLSGWVVPEAVAGVPKAAEEKRLALPAEA